MKTRDDYDRVFALVREMINAWDPTGLIGGGAPADEWEDEVARLVAMVPQIRSEADAAAAVSSIFTASLAPERVSDAECAQIGAQLHHLLCSEKQGGSSH